MKIPKKIKVGSAIYKVKIVDLIENDRLGETQHSKLEVRIKKGARFAMEQTFLHELFHCFNTAVGAEELIENFANSLHQFIKENPKVFK